MAGIDNILRLLLALMLATLLAGMLTTIVAHFAPTIASEGGGEEARVGGPPRRWRERVWLT